MRTLTGAVFGYVVPEARLITDDWAGYRTVARSLRENDDQPLRPRLRQRRVHTHTIKGFFGTLKNGIRGNYHSVSPKWLRGYLNEYVWRYNRKDAVPMFNTLAFRVVDTGLAAC